MSVSSLGTVQWRLFERQGSLLEAPGVPGHGLIMREASDRIWWNGSRSIETQTRIRSDILVAVKEWDAEEEAVDVYCLNAVLSHSA